ncbi:hypothetical protein OF83DRAFT_1086843 [Amylostereum chailletii]|nr:hypothetical protein OF83DRAFT_1086843 [Amylostereum chailletii]
MSETETPPVVLVLPPAEMVNVFDRVKLYCGWLIGRDTVNAWIKESSDEDVSSTEYLGPELMLLEKALKKCGASLEVGFGPDSDKYMVVAKSIIPPLAVAFGVKEAYFFPEDEDTKTKREAIEAANPSLRGKLVEYCNEMLADA